MIAPATVSLHSGRISPGPPFRRRPAPVAAVVAALLIGAPCSRAAAQAPAVGNPYGDSPIEDNSFLIEEAYNQEDGVIQHISTFSRPTSGSGWASTFTEEWPTPRQAHQLSLTLSSLSTGDHAGLGDAALNYRYQWLHGSRTWLAPRVSLLIPTGDPKRGLGTGGWGLQANLPVSVRASRLLVAHTNIGYTWVRDARGLGGGRSDTRAVNVGQSLVALVSPKVNLMLEAIWSEFETPEGPQQTRVEHAAVVSPGLRFAFDVAGGLQIVPGVALPIGVGPSSGERSVLLYLSFEHPFAPLAR